MELRRNKRYQLNVPVSFYDKRAERPISQLMGTTRDISSGGVFIATTDLLPVGSIVQMEIRLSQMRIKLRTQGRVVRTELNGFGAVADTGFRMLLRDSSSDGAFNTYAHGEKRQKSMVMSH